MFKLKKRQKKELRRISAYMVSGGAQFWSGYAAFAVLDIVFSMSFWPARVLSYGLGVVVNYYLERYWVFKSKRMSKKQIDLSARKYYSLMATNFALDMAIVGGLYEIFGVTAYIGQFVSAGYFTVWNYVLFKVWVFAKKRRSPNRLPVRSASVSTKTKQKKVARTKKT
ncbi:hypothetical protein BH23PAT2_BH23PAT2_05820 [soil metagenome]